MQQSPHRFYTYYFTFHDLFAPLCLMALSIYISLKFTGVTAEMKWKRQIYIAISLGIVLVSMVLAIPATVQAGVFQDNPPDGGEFKEECRSWDVYTMIITYSIFSSVLFCLTFSFLFSLCILGSPLLRDVYDPDEHTQRWRLLLTLSLVNIFYIISGFLLNFKELSRLLYRCCLVTSLIDGKKNSRYLKHYCKIVFLQTLTTSRMTCGTLCCWLGSPCSGPWSGSPSTWPSSWTMTTSSNQITFVKSHKTL